MARTTVHKPTVGGKERFQGGGAGVGWRELRTVRQTASQKPELTWSPAELRLPPVEEQELLAGLIERITKSDRPQTAWEGSYDWRDVLREAAFIPHLTTNEQAWIDRIREKVWPRLTKVEPIKVPEVYLVLVELVKDKVGEAEMNSRLLFVVADAVWLPLLSPEKIFFGREAVIDNMPAIWQELFSGARVNFSNASDRTRGVVDNIVQDNLGFINGVFNDVSLVAEWSGHSFHLSARQSIGLSVREVAPVT